MIPLRDDNPTVRASLATFLLVAINVAVWVFIQGLGFDPDLRKSVWLYGVIPAELLGHVDPGTRVPAGEGLTVLLDGAPNWWSVITSMFMHGGWLHIIGNMWFLLVFGDNVEDAMGRFRFMTFYLLCGVAAVLAQVLVNPDSTVPMVGASGAISGVMGAYLLLYPRAPVHVLVFLGFFATRVVVPAFFMLGYWFLLQVISGTYAQGQGGVAFWAHVGGFVAGLIWVLPFCNPRRLADCRKRRGRARKMFYRA